MEAPFHQRFHTSRCHQFHGLHCGILAVRRAHNLEATDIKLSGLSRGTDTLWRANQYRPDEAKFRGIDASSKRDVVAWVSYGDIYRYTRLSLLEQLFILFVAHA